MHFHQDALNALAYGRKRWLMLPPPRAVYSKRHPLELLDDERYLAGGDLETWECMQEAGDIMYVPNHWAHATINIEEFHWSGVRVWHQRQDDAQLRREMIQRGPPEKGRHASEMAFPRRRLCVLTAGLGSNLPRARASQRGT
ncbi:unnamed protein product [Prorocentrum cordatum]|uniref:JmjC domain-containing protein n=1 Tax=Prorocentrum cordatum TaxID=2364126 RepID=A0ABN9URD8_9DINO|nr:unnamed protein product [Polarella glacialis]